MAQEIPWELREQAEELYITDGRTYDDVARATGIAVQTLKKWGAAEGWPDRRREYRETLGEIKRNTVLLRKRLLAKALKTLNPQDVFAISSLESAAAKAKGGEQAPPVRIERPIATAHDAVAALEEAVERQVNLLLARPDGMTPAVLRDLRKSFELIDEMKRRYRTDEENEKPKGLTADTAEEIRKHILGIAT